MKTNSIQFRFLITILSAMLAITIVVGGVSIYKIDHFVQQETENFIKVTCEKEAAQMNDIFGDMEKSVNIMSGYILNFLESPEDIKSPDRQEEIVQSADRMFADVANHTTGTVAYYLRFSPELSDSKAGFFYSKIPGGDQFFLLEATDLSNYEKDDTERVGWFWQPYEAGEPVWMQPYYNKNNGIMMISYVVPLYCEDQFIGVVGMDFDYAVLNDKVNQIKIYEHGFARLAFDGITISHEADSSDYYIPEEYIQVSSELVNGMTLTLSASYDDIRQIRYDIEKQILHTGLVLVAVFCLITCLMVNKIVKPMRELTDAAKRLTDGDYSVEPVQSDTYEIQLLSTAFENMAMHLREHEKHQYLLAHTDSMTGLRNTTSYNMWVTDFNKEIRNKNMDFGVIVLDVNDLKEANDKYGHDVGNKLLMTVARMIANVFRRSPVFRIGGDEFVVILRNRDLEERKELCKKLDRVCANECIRTDTETIPISIARGFAKYNPAVDEQFMDVFNRADDAMYRNKKKMKSLQKSPKLLGGKDTVHS